MAEQMDTVAEQPETPDNVIIKAKRVTVTRLRLFGPTTGKEGRELAAAVNAVIAQYNTMFFKNPDGTEILPKITADTGNAV